MSSIRWRRSPGEFVADETIDRQIVEGLRSRGHSVLFIAEVEPSVDDETVLAHSREQDAVLLTADKDFGELVFRQRLLHCGILLVRLAGLGADVKAQLVVSVVNRHADELRLGFAVLTRRAFRVRKPV
jgi:predicted nuclease of predicted toxin-antitoxin system